MLAVKKIQALVCQELLSWPVVNALNRMLLKNVIKLFVKPTDFHFGSLAHFTELSQKTVRELFLAGELT